MTGISECSGTRSFIALCGIFTELHRASESSHGYDLVPRARLIIFLMRRGQHAPTLGLLRITRFPGSHCIYKSEQDFVKIPIHVQDGFTEYISSIEDDVSILAPKDTSLPRSLVARKHVVT
jgi:hypothetical protein